MSTPSLRAEALRLINSKAARPCKFYGGYDDVPEAQRQHSFIGFLARHGHLPHLSAQLVDAIIKVEEEIVAARRVLDAATSMADAAQGRARRAALAAAVIHAAARSAHRAADAAQSAADAELLACGNFAACPNLGSVADVYHARALAARAMSDACSADVIASNADRRSDHAAAASKVAEEALAAARDAYRAVALHEP